MAGILEFEREFPEVPIGPTYRAELELFRGNYEVAEELFTESWRTTRTRWSYVGRGGSLVLQGRYKEALAVFAEGEEYLSGYIDGEATHAYVGEAYLRLGDLESARKHLQFAVEVGRSRLGALLVMAQLELACGDPAPAADLLARAQFLAPALMWEASRDGPSMEDEIGNALGMLKGNRSSNLATFQDRKGVWRVTRLVWGDGVRARTQASQSGTYADELWTLMNAE
jgi:tetratricopeptide (TPR) repeat protein